MPKRNRATLRKCFGDGEMPSSDGFADLIESMLCILDDGIDHTPKDGLRLRQIGANKLLSFYRDIDVQSVIWSLAIDKSGDSLTINAGGQQAPWITLANDAPYPAKPVPPRVGINQPTPVHTLDVGGTVASQGRIGARGAMSAPADGDWHTITGKLSGCTALEVTAGAGREKAGRYAIMHAYALSTFNSKNSITYHQAHYDSKCNRIELQWVACKDDKGKDDGDLYELQIRVGCPYGPDLAIQYYLTQLWFDPEMKGCKSTPPQEPVL